MEVTDSVPTLEIPRDHVAETAKEMVIGIVGGVTQVMIGMFRINIHAKLYCHGDKVYNIYSVQSLTVIRATIWFVIFLISFHCHQTLTFMAGRYYEGADAD